MSTSTLDTIIATLTERLPGVEIRAVHLDRESVEKGEPCTRVSGVFDGRGVEATFRKSNHMDAVHIAKVLASRVRRLRSGTLS